MIASLPMYDWPEVHNAHSAFWRILAAELNCAGFGAPAELTRDSEGDDHWLHPDLLFSQTCGYPYATRLMGQVSLLATPCYAVEGCEEATYSSAIIVRNDAGASSLEEAFDGVFAYNSEDSLSGYRCFIPLIGDPVSRFASSKVSGGHRRSATMVASGEANCAAIDAVCWDLFQRFEPDHASRLRVLAWGPRFPALPYITRKAWSGERAEALRDALRKAVAKASADPVAKSLKISRVAEPDHAAYAELRLLS